MALDIPMIKMTQFLTFSPQDYTIPGVLNPLKIQLVELIFTVHMDMVYIQLTLFASMSDGSRPVLISWPMILEFPQG